MGCVPPQQEQQDAGEGVDEGTFVAKGDCSSPCNVGRLIVPPTSLEIAASCEPKLHPFPWKSRADRAPLPCCRPRPGIADASAGALQAVHFPAGRGRGRYCCCCCCCRSRRWRRCRRGGGCIGDGPGALERCVPGSDAAQVRLLCERVQVGRPLPVAIAAAVAGAAVVGGMVITVVQGALH